MTLIEQAEWCFTDAGYYSVNSVQRMIWTIHCSLPCRYMLNNSIMISTPLFSFASRVETDKHVANIHASLAVIFTQPFGYSDTRMRCECSFWKQQICLKLLLYRNVRKCLTRTPVPYLPHNYNKFNTYTVSLILVLILRSHLCLGLANILVP